jgi:cobalt-zinc-cadmium efflux system membrane fusion protein
MVIERKSAALGAVAGALLLALAYGGLRLWRGEARPPAGAEAPKAAAPARPPAARTVELSPQEFEKFRVYPVAEREFRIQREVLGGIDFNQEASSGVYPTVAGKILEIHARAGDDVAQGARLYTVDSPDLVQAESTLISAAGTLALTGKALARTRQLFEVQGASQKDLDQAASDQQAAEGALRAARDAVRILGKTPDEVEAIIAGRKVDSVLVVRSPIAGRVTARNAAPGLFVQPGSAPAPFTVTDLSTMWMLASVPEADIPLLALDQEVEVAVKAYPGRLFRGRIVNIGASVDPATRRLQVRSEVRDPRHELRAGMFATFLIRTGRTERSLAVPEAGVVREGDGTLSVWVNTAARRLERRAVRVGLQQDGMRQILEGLAPGERVATDGAIFLSNALTAASR